MKPVIKTILLTALLASLTALSQAQPGAGPGGPGPGTDMCARMHEHMGQRAADIKAKLKLTPEQEGAWTTYTAAMKSSANIKRPDRADIDKFSTPERLDRMRELRKQRDAEMDKREAATRAFYAALFAEQKKIFDANTGRPLHRGGPQGPRKE